MKKKFFLNKKEGETPLEAVENFRKKHKEYKNIPMTYAGRLDPMASGKLLILAGEEVKNKNKYLSLDKEYVFQVLFGFSTDTYDILGKIVKNDFKAYFRFSGGGEFFKKEIKRNLKSFIGKSKQKYPIYSSKTVKGKPLFLYARNKEEVEIPTKEIFIKKISLKNVRKTDNSKLLKNIKKRIKKVNGDFRQEEILNIWEKNLLNKNYFFLATFNVHCSSGTYVRSIAHNLGDKIGVPALAFSIKRTKIC